MACTAPRAPSILRTTHRWERLIVFEVKHCGIEFPCSLCAHFTNQKSQVRRESATQKSNSNKDTHNTTLLALLPKLMYLKKGVCSSAHADFFIQSASCLLMRSGSPLSNTAMGSRCMTRTSALPSSPWTSSRTLWHRPLCGSRSWCLEGRRTSQRW